MYLSLKEELKNRCVHVLNKTRNQTASRRGRATTVRQYRNVQKRLMHVQSCCFATLKLLLFSCSRR